MDRSEVKEIIKATVRETIEELSRRDRIKDNDYAEAAQLVTEYYKGNGLPEIARAIIEVSKDAYFEIIPRYFRDGETIEQLATEFNCEVTTISRNKKRLCLEILRRAK